MAKANGSGIVPLIQPNMILGENTSVHPAALRDGESALLQNLRIRERIPVVRGACTKLTPSVPVAGASYKGSWCGKLNGNFYLVAAYLVSGSIRIYLLNTSTWGWSELTASSGYFGSTFLTTSVYDVEFCKVPVTRDGKRDVLVIYAQSSGYPIVWDPSQPAGMTVSKLLPISVPGSADAYQSVQSFPVYANLQSGTFAFTQFNTRFSFAYNGSAPNRNIKLTMSGSTQANDWAVIDMTAGLTKDLSNSRQLVLRVNETGSSGFLSLCKVEISEDGSSWFVVGDPSDINKSPVTVSDSLVAGVTWFAYSLSGIASASRDAVRYIRITTTVNAVAASAYCNIGLIAGSGNIPGLSDWCVSFRNHYSGAESPRQYLSVGSMTPVANLGGGRMGASTGPIERIPNSSLLYYTYSLTIANPNNGATITDLANHPTRADFHIRYSGNSTYGWFNAATVYAASGGNWTGTPGATLSVTYGSSNYTGMDETIYPPDGTHGYIPRPTCMAYTGARLMMGGDYAQPNDMYFSDHSMPFRFRPTARFSDVSSIDGLSGSRNTFPNPIVGLALIGNNVQGQEYGVPTIAVWTTKELYRIYGLDCTSISRPAFVAPHGLARSKAWARYELSVYWLDDEKQIRRLSPDGIIPISKGKEDRRLRTGQTSQSSAVFWRDSLYISFADAGDADNQRLLVWDEQPTDNSLGVWTSDYYRFGIGGLLAMDDGSYQKLLAFGTTGHVYQLEDSTRPDDDGDAIIVKVRSRELHQNMWDAFWVNQVGIVADGCGSGSYADVVCTYKPAGATANWTQFYGNSISLDAGTDLQVWRLTPDLPYVSADVDGLSCQIEITANMKAGARIYSARAWIEPRIGAEDRL